MWKWGEEGGGGGEDQAGSGLGESSASTKNSDIRYFIEEAFRHPRNNLLHSSQNQTQCNSGHLLSLYLLYTQHTSGSTCRLPPRHAFVRQTVPKPSVKQRKYRKYPFPSPPRKKKKAFPVNNNLIKRIPISNLILFTLAFLVLVSWIPFTWMYWCYICSH